jgi:peptidoglycan/LPS O-acetylase OafA/YrhL
MGNHPGQEDVMGVIVPAVLFVMLFSFLSVAVWVDGQKKEREAFYKAETLRRITESSGEALELLREETRLENLKKYEGIKLGGLICIAVGVALMIFLKVQTASEPGAPYLVGLIPGLIGVAMLVYVYGLAGHTEQGPKD